MQNMRISFPLELLRRYVVIHHEVDKMIASDDRETILWRPFVTVPWICWRLPKKF